MLFVMPKFRQLSIFLLLVTLMTSFYMLTFRGRIESGDTLRAMDALTSQSRYGDWLMDESVWFKYFFRVRIRSDLPLTSYDVEEKLNLYLATPLLKLAESIPRMGNIHTVWLFNVIITALNVGLLYLIVRALNYDDWVAVGVAITVGFTTNMWVYSQTFFREPLVSFFILMSLFGIQLCYRRGWLLRVLSVAWAIGMFQLAILTKYSALMVLPALVFFAVPSLQFLDNQRFRKFLLWFLILQVLGLCLLMLFNPIADMMNLVLSRSNVASESIAYILRIYILSPGGSLWGTSPILLMAIIGCTLLLKQNQHRLVWTIWLAFVGYTVGHAMVTGSDWFGGQSWPPRFLVPIIPVLMIAIAPVIEKIIHQRHKLLGLGWVLLFGYGMWIQFSGVSLMWYQYENSLPLESNGLTEWEPGLTQFNYFRWVILPQRWADLGLDFLWMRTGVYSWGIQFGVLTTLILGNLLWVIRHPKSRLVLVTPILIIVWSGLVVLNIRAVYDKDPVVQSHKQALHDMLGYVTEHSNPDDILILPNNFYERFVLNHLDVASPRPIVLQPELAEPASERQAADVVSSNPNDWLPLSSVRALHHIAVKHDRFWYLANTSPFMSWSFRPFERYMALYYYPLREIELENPDETVRLLEYSTRSPAPNPFSTLSADYATDLTYGDHIQLLGFQLPNQVRYERGQAVELSLLWQTDTQLDHDYTVAWFIADAETGQMVAQGQDSMPQAGFAPTTSWQPNFPVWDNRALRLPDDLVAGDYAIWVLMYRYNPESSSIERLSVLGDNVLDNDTVGVLPITIVIDE
jgi:hypothetical protein